MRTITPTFPTFPGAARRVVLACVCLTCALTGPVPAAHAASAPAAPVVKPTPRPAWFSFSSPAKPKSARLATRTKEEAAKDEAVLLANPGGERRALLTSGRRTLHLRLRGGEAPYHLHLFRETDGKPEQHIADATLDAPRPPVLRLPSVLTPGRYRLILKDKNDFAADPDPLNGPADELRLEVLPPDQRPAPSPDDRPPAPLTESERLLRYASWLTHQADDAWTLEALQLVAPLAPEDKAAAEWMDELVNQWTRE